MKNIKLFGLGSMAAMTAMLGVAITPQIASASLLTNPGFEDVDNNGDQGDGWGSFGAAGFNAFFGANGHASLFADTVGNSGGIFQTGISGDAGVEYTFTLTDTFVESNARADLTFGLEFYLADDATLISSEVAAIDLSDQNVNHGGGLVFSTSAVAPIGTAFVRPVILFENADPFASGSSNIFVFDASLTAVPEPTSAAAAGIAGLCLLARRRRS